MGCHTWCYKRLNITEELKEQYKQEALASVNYYINREYPKGDAEFFSEMEKLREEILEEKVLEEIQEGSLSTILDWIANFSICKFGDDYYDCSDTPHDPFRVYGYPEGFWLDADSLIKFLKSYNQDDITDPDGNKGVTPKLEETIRELFKTVDLIDFG